MYVPSVNTKEGFDTAGSLLHVWGYVSISAVQIIINYHRGLPLQNESNELSWYQIDREGFCNEQNYGEEKRKKKTCRNPGLNQGPLDLQSNALPTELFRLLASKHTQI